MKKIFTLIFILLLLSLFFFSQTVWGQESLFEGDADRTEIILTPYEDHLINQITLRYEWDEVYQGDGVVVGMTASVQ